MLHSTFISYLIILTASLSITVIGISVICPFMTHGTADVLAITSAI
jgi:hypothetical protein